MALVSSKGYTRIVVQQLGGFWSFEFNEWREFVLDLIAKQRAVYELPDDKAYKRRPPFVGSFKDLSSGSVEFYSRLKHYLVISPLDWDLDTFKYHLEHDLQVEEEL